MLWRMWIKEYARTGYNSCKNFVPLQIHLILLNWLTVDKPANFDSTILQISNAWTLHMPTIFSMYSPHKVSSKDQHKKKATALWLAPQITLHVESTASSEFKRAKSGGTIVITYPLPLATGLAAYHHNYALHLLNNSTFAGAPLFTSLQLKGCSHSHLPWN